MPRKILRLTRIINLRNLSGIPENQQEDQLGGQFNLKENHHSNRGGKSLHQN